MKISAPVFLISRILLPLFLLISVALQCINLPDPDNPSNSAIDLELGASNGFCNKQLIIDTVGENVTISILRFFPAYIKTTTLRIVTLDGVTEWDSTLLIFTTKTEDTINVIKKVITAGDKKVIATAYIENGTVSSDTALLNIINRSGSNTRPDFTINGALTLKTGETCSLFIEIADPDNNQTHSIIARYKGVDSILTSSSFTWKPADGFIGKDSVIFTVTDNGTPPLSATKTAEITITERDTGTTDTVPPSVTLKNPSLNGARVLSLPLTIQIACRDENGIDSVRCETKGTKLAISERQDSLYSVQITELSAGKSDTIYFTITDNSTEHNSRSFPVIVNYNRPPSELVISSPATGAAGVTRSPSFTWSGGIDPDEDSVFYKVVYGTAVDSLTSQTAVFSTLPVTLPSGTILEPKTVYYWRLIAWTRIYNDTVRSNVVSFTTTGTGPAFLEHPQNQQIRVGQKAFFSVAAIGTDLIYQWQTNGAAIPGATSPICSTSQVTAADNGATYRCMVYNALDTVFSNDASLTVLHSITYDANTATGNVPVDTNGYALGSRVIIKSGLDISSGTPVSKTGYTFSGWSTNSTGSGKTYRSDGTDTLKMPLAPVMLYAKWVIDTFTVTFISTATTVFQTQRITYNGQATLPATQPALAGNVFEGWFTTNDAGGVAFDFSSPITADRTLYARFAPVYSVLYHENGGIGSVPTDSKMYKSGDQVTVFGNTGGLTNANNDFAGWTRNEHGTGTVYNAGDYITVTSGDVHLYAKWTIRQCQITYNTHGGTPVNSHDVPSGSQIAEPVSTLSGLTLVGWYTDAGYTNRWDFSTAVTSSMTLHAKWEVRDRDGNTYDTVRIGTQTWMVQNLRTTKYNDGTPIPKVEDADEWTDLTSAAFCWPQNNPTYGPIHGARYNHYVARASNIAPSGWHVPSFEEWQTLCDYLQTNDQTLDGVIFQASKGGSRDSYGTFVARQEDDTWWLTTAFSPPEWFWSPTIGIPTFYSKPGCGLSIRCIKDN
ncbi:MAG: InlB B-repeat-containing protein [Chitinispirillaceae bacterium]|nr:InlB B-repeat-containing protein [Chitinispirillaceae bacterium]